MRLIDHGLSQEFDLKNSNDVTKRKCFIDARECCAEVLFSLYKYLYKSLERKWQKFLAWNVVYGYSNYVKNLDREWALLMIDIIWLYDSLKFAQFLREDFEEDDFKTLENLIYSIKGDERISQLRVLWSKKIKR